MKMRPYDFKQLADNMHAIMAKYPYIKEDYKERNLSETRMRWDLFYCTDFNWRFKWIDKVYKYLNDDHIDTALRKIVG